MRRIKIFFIIFLLFGIVYCKAEMTGEINPEKIDYDVSWKVGENSIPAVMKEPEDELPVRYDYREEGRNPAVRSQGLFGTCWAFASLTALESTGLPEYKEIYSPDHMSIRNSFQRSQDEGGEYTMSMAYLTAWQGPVAESDDIYGDGKSPEGLKAVRHVQEIQKIGEKEYDKIKSSVYNYGGVQSSIYTSLTNPTSQSKFFNRDNAAYCYIGAENPNHDIVIIGWDDNYPKENFTVEPEGNGAFICQNSWGERFGDKGIFYISYFDTNVGIYNVVYTKIEEPNNFSRIYQSDLCGWGGQIGYGEEEVLFANVFTVEEEESVAAAGFYTTGENTQYEVYIVPKFGDPSSLNKRIFVQGGIFENAGFYTVNFLKTFPVKQGEKFAVVVKIKTPDAIQPVVIEYSGESKENVDVSDGEGYISPNGVKWSRTEDQNCNLCLKAYTK